MCVCLVIYPAWCGLRCPCCFPKIPGSRLQLLLPSGFNSSVTSLFDISLHLGSHSHVSVDAPPYQGLWCRAGNSNATEFESCLGEGCPLLTCCSCTNCTACEECKPCVDTPRQTLDLPSSLQVDAGATVVVSSGAHVNIQGPVEIQGQWNISGSVSVYSSTVDLSTNSGFLLLNPHAVLTFDGARVQGASRTFSTVPSLSCLC